MLVYTKFSMPKDDSARKRIIVEEVTDETEKVAEPVAVAPVPAPAVEEIVAKEESAPVETVSEPTAPVTEVVEKEEPAEAVDTPTDAPEEPTPVQDVPLIPDPSFQPEPMNKTNPLLIIIPGILILGALLGGIYFYQKGIDTAPEPTPTPTEVSEIMPVTPSETPGTTLTLSKYPINIQNGSGTPGEAGKVKNILVTGGFTVAGTGNASSYDFTKTVIKSKADVPEAFVSELSKLLGKTYVMDTNTTLATSSANQVEVIVGSSKAK